MKKKRNVLLVNHDGSQVWLDVDRIVAIDRVRGVLYFECTVWKLEDDEEMSEIWDAWLGN